MIKKNVPIAVIKRLPRYFRYLSDLLKNNTMAKISSQELSRSMGLTASQIRQDLNCFGGFGQQGYGYNVKSLYYEIGNILGVDKLFKAIVIGAGNLGVAIANNVNFVKRGVKLIGIFDVAQSKIGAECNNLAVLDMDKLEAFCKEHKPQIAILTLPKTVAPEVFLRLKNCGIKGFWNFSNMELPVTETDVIENVHLGDSLMTLCYSIKEKEETISN